MSTKTTGLKIDHPYEPMEYGEALEYTENWLEQNIVTDAGRREGIKCSIYDYHDREASNLSKRPWAGVRVAEVSFHTHSGGGSYMQVDQPWGIAVCGQVERCILALIEAWNRDAQIKVDRGGEYKDLAETDEEFWRLGELFNSMNKGD